MSKLASELPDDPESHKFTILRGQRIEEFSTEELVSLHGQIEDELPADEDELDQYHGHLLELSLIEDELEKRE